MVHRQGNGEGNGDGHGGDHGDGEDHETHDDEFRVNRSERFFRDEPQPPPPDPLGSHGSGDSNDLSDQPESYDAIWRQIMAHAPGAPEEQGGDGGQDVDELQRLIGLGVELVGWEIMLHAYREFREKEKLESILLRVFIEHATPRQVRRVLALGIFQLITLEDGG